MSVWRGERSVGVESEEGKGVTPSRMSPSAIHHTRGISYSQVFMGRGCVKIIRERITHKEGERSTHTAKMQRGESLRKPRTVADVISPDTCTGEDGARRGMPQRRSLQSLFRSRLDEGVYARLWMNASAIRQRTHLCHRCLVRWIWEKGGVVR